eukprot:6943490-Ditylum_brightwellii.AAC.1
MGFYSKELHGRACLICGNKWVTKEDLGGHLSFVAIRPPHHDVIPLLVEVTSSDIIFSLPYYFMTELRGLAAMLDSDSFDLDDPSECELNYIVEASKNASLPSDEVMTAAITRLCSAVEVWLNRMAKGPKFLYDDSWGGFVNCACSLPACSIHLLSKFNASAPPLMPLVT